MNREMLADSFVDASRKSPWKTFVIEAHHSGSEELLSDAFGEKNVRPTEDVYMYNVSLNGNSESVDFVVDCLNDRFWSFHTSSSTRDAARYIREVIGTRRDLDWIWLPSNHIRHIWPDASPRWISTDYNSRVLMPFSDDVSDLKLRVRGKSADDVFRLIQQEHRAAASYAGVAFDFSDDNMGDVQEVITHNGRFSAMGTDFSFHQAIVSQAVTRYEALVRGFERRALGWASLAEGGSSLEGWPITLMFSHPIPDLVTFVDQLFSSREPFRLWGLPSLADDGLVEVEAVDLHVGHQLRFDITAEWLRVYLFEGGCGNSIARLAANLQRCFDGALRIVDSELDSHLQLSVQT